MAKECEMQNVPFDAPKLINLAADIKSPEGKKIRVLNAIQTFAPITIVQSPEQPPGQ